MKLQKSMLQESLSKSPFLRRVQLRFTTRTRFIIACVLAVALIGLPFPVSYLASSVNRSKQVRNPEASASSRAMQPSPAQEPQLATIYNPYWYVDQYTTATLEIANHAETARTLTPVLFLRGTERVALNPVDIPALGTARVSLNQALRSYLDKQLKLDTRLNRAGEGAPSSPVRARWGDGSRRSSLWGAALLQGESTDHIFSAIVSEDGA